jgi:hypothetical protein
MAHDQTQVRLGLGRRLGKTERAPSVGKAPWRQAAGSNWANNGPLEQTDGGLALGQALLLLG